MENGYFTKALNHWCRSAVGHDDFAGGREAGLETVPFNICENFDNLNSPIWTYTSRL